ncbi:MAG TPA: DUF6334 family protein [Pontibacter sp.]
MEKINLSGEFIKDIYIRPFDEESNNFDKLILFLTTKIVVIEVDNDTDELSIKVINQPESVESFLLDGKYENPVWSKSLKEKRIIGSWLANNQQGYFDLFALGVDEFIPNFIISCAASQLNIGQISFLTRTHK